MGRFSLPLIEVSSWNIPKLTLFSFSSSFSPFLIISISQTRSLNFFAISKIPTKTLVIFLLIYSCTLYQLLYFFLHLLLFLGLCSLSLQFLIQRFLYCLFFRDKTDKLPLLHWQRRRHFISDHQIFLEILTNESLNNSPFLTSLVREI